MAKPILSDGLWAAIEPLLPVHQPSAKGGRAVDDKEAYEIRAALAALAKGLAEAGCSPR